MNHAEASPGRGEHMHGRELAGRICPPEWRTPAEEDSCAWLLQRARQQQQRLEQPSWDKERGWKSFQKTVHSGLALAKHMEEQAAYLRRELQETVELAQRSRYLPRKVR